MYSQAELKSRREAFRHAAKAAGIRLTPQRLQIFDLVAASDTHPGAEEIFTKLRPHMPTLSLDTVYRTLWMLADLGLVTTVGARRDNVRFDTNLQHHHHFVCIRCGMIGDFVNRDLNTLPMPVEACGFGKSISLHVEVRGVCDKCLKKEAKNTDIRNQ